MGREAAISKIWDGAIRVALDYHTTVWQYPR